MKNQKSKINIHKLLSFLLIFSLSSMLLALRPIYAATPTAEPKATEAEKEEKLIEQINNLKEKVASKVAELRLVEKRGIIIVVKEVAGNKITGEDLGQKVRIIDVDELTKFSSPTAKSFGISDIKEGMTISTIGLYNKQSKRILARFIDVANGPVFITGIVKSVDKANFTVTILSENDKSYTIDIENVTKTSTYTEDDNIKRSGFSRIETGSRVYVVGFSSKTEKNRITASRFIIFPELPGNPKIEFQETQPTSTPVNNSAPKSSTPKPSPR